MMTKYVLDHFDSIMGRLAAVPRVFLGLDYDGTLTPIVNDRQKAWLGNETRDMLVRLVARPGTTVGVISGRRLDDVRNHVNVAGIVYAGNHGLDVSGPGLRFIESGAASRMHELHLLAESLRRRLQPISGVEVEDKELTLSIHFRRVISSEEENVRRIVESLMPNTDNNFSLTLGHKVFEIRPQVIWNKSHAIKMIADHFECAADAVVYVGDDETDEDAFNAMPNAVTIKVGEAFDTSARYYVKSPADVQVLLTRFANLPQPKDGE